MEVHLQAATPRARLPDWDESRLRASDVMAFLKFFTDFTFRQMELEASKEKDEYEWTEEDDAALSDIVEAIDAEGAGDVPEEGSEESEEDSDNGEDDHG